MPLNPGDAIHAYCAFTLPFPSWKFLICVCPSTLLFFLISSEPRRLTPDAQIKIQKKEDLPFLDHDSYINTAIICTIDSEELKKSIHKGSLPPHIKRKILETLQALNCKYLSFHQNNLIKTNLSKI